MKQMKTENVTNRVAIKSRKNKDTFGEKVFYALNYLILVLLGISTLFPFLNLISKSLSGEAAVISGMVTLLPIDFQIGTYKFVLDNSLFLNSFKITVFITIVGTLISLFMTVITAYPLSKLRLRGRRFIMIFFVFTMLFSGGMIPTYLLMQNLKLINTIHVLILPGILSVFNMLIVKNYFESLPESLEESAKLDGASNIVVMLKIFLPLSKPVLATVALFYAVGLWNSYFSAMLYVTKPHLKPLQLYLKELLTSTDETLRQSGQTTMSVIDEEMNKTPESVQAASIVVATVPILCVYPFLQKYFVKGVIIGSVKG